MSILLVACAGIVFVLVAIAVVAVVLVMRGDSDQTRARLEAATTQGQTTLATDLAFYFRFEGADARDAMALVEADGGELGPAQTREAALSLTRLAPSATHAYLGPASWPPVKAYSPVTAGAIVGFRATTRVQLDTVSDDRQLTDVTATLRAVSSLPDAQIVGGLLALAEDSRDPDAPRLVAVDAGGIPGHRPCPHCRTPIQTFATRCSACGARALR